MNWFLVATGLLMAIIPLSLPAVAQESGPAHPAFAACLDFDRAACGAVLETEPGNLTALFLRGLAAELDADDAAALTDFVAVATREPRHFGAHLWRHVAAATLGQADPDMLRAYLDRAALPPWPKGLGLLYLGEMSVEELLSHAAAQPAGARIEALCAAHYHIGRAAYLAGDVERAMAAFREALATGASHVFEYQAAERALIDMP